MLFVTEIHNCNIWQSKCKNRLTVPGVFSVVGSRDLCVVDGGT